MIEVYRTMREYTQDLELRQARDTIKTLLAERAAGLESIRSLLTEVSILKIQLSSAYAVISRHREGGEAGR